MLTAANGEIRGICCDLCSFAIVRCQEFLQRLANVGKP